MPLAHYLLVALGGATGAVARALLGKLFDSRFPWSTLLINVLGSFLIGVFLAFFIANPLWKEIDEELLAGGLCGGFTTFSSFSFQTMTLFRQGRRKAAVANILLSIVVSLLAVWAGEKVGQLVF